MLKIRHCFIGKAWLIDYIEKQFEILLPRLRLILGPENLTHELMMFLIVKELLSIYLGILVQIYQLINPFIITKIWLDDCKTHQLLHVIPL